MTGRPLLALLLLPLALAVPSPAAAQSDQAHRLAAPAWQLALLAEDAWAAAPATTRSDERWSDGARAHLLAFAGAARFTAERLSRRETTPEQAAELLRTLESVASTTQQALDRLRASDAVRRAFFEARGSLSALADLQAGRTAPVAPAPATPPATTAPPAVPVTPTPAPVDPDAPRAEITEARWKKAFRPDLVVTGRLEGRGLKSGELQLVDASGRVIHGRADEINAAIAAATAGLRDTMLVTVEYEVGIDNAQIPSGDVTVRVLVRDAKAREGRAETTVTRRLF